MQDLWRSKEKAGEPKALQPGKHAVGGEEVLSQLGNKEKQNDPAADLWSSLGGGEGLCWPIHTRGDSFLPTLHTPQRTEVHPLSAHHGTSSSIMSATVLAQEYYHAQSITINTLNQ